MRPVTTNHEAEPADVESEITHFTHHHPLQHLLNHDQQPPCSLYTYPILTAAYSCKECAYYLHIACSKLQEQLQHPFDTNKTHFFRLLPKPVYSQGWFRCDACGHKGCGYSYHCSDCQLDMHTICAILPSEAFLPGHRHHFSLVCSPPSENIKFMCYVCRKPGSNSWLYKCKTCLIDVHLGCLRETQWMGMPYYNLPAERPLPLPGNVTATSPVCCDEMWRVARIASFADFVAAAVLDEAVSADAGEVE